MSATCRKDFRHSVDDGLRSACSRRSTASSPISPHQRLRPVGSGSGDLWLDSYATDFLAGRARQGYDVPERAVTRALSNLQNSLGYDQDVQDRGSRDGLRALCSGPQQEGLGRRSALLCRHKAGSLHQPAGSASLAQHLPFMAMRSGARRPRSRPLSACPQPPPTTSTAPTMPRRCVRRPILALAADSKPAPSVNAGTGQAGEPANGHRTWTSTQDNAWMLARARPEGETTPSR